MDIYSTAKMAETAPPDHHSNALTLTLTVIAAVTLVRFAHLVLTPIPLGFDEAQYWSWGQSFEFGYFSKPPLIAWVIMGFTGLFGDSEAAVRAFAPLGHAATAGFIFLLTRDLFDERTGLWAAITYILLPGVSLGAMLASTDALLLPCWAAALWLFHRAITHTQWRWWLALGAAAGLGLLAKYAMIYLWLGAALFLFLARDTRPVGWPLKALAATAMALAVYSPNLIWNAGMGWPSYTHTSENVNLGAHLFNVDNALEFFGGQFAVFGPILFAVLLILVLRLSQVTGASRGIRYCLIFALPVLGLILFQSFLSRAHANWAAVAYVPATIAVTAWLLQKGKTFWLQASLALHVAAASLVYNMDALREMVPNVPDPAADLRHWPEAGRWLGTVIAQDPDRPVMFEDRATMAWLLFYTPDGLIDPLMWNPRPFLRNHYEMTSDFIDSGVSDVLFVRRLYDPERLRPSFDEFAQVATFSSAPPKPLALQAYALDGFKGYER